MTQEEKSVLGVKEIAEVSEKLGVIEGLKAKLVKQPDPAAAKLLAVLEELSKTYSSFEVELARYLSLTLEPEELKTERGVLIELEGGKISARMAGARGHCSRINNIFQRYLSPWFQRVLKPDEIGQMNQVFFDLSHSDSVMLELIDRVSGWLAEEAFATDELMTLGKWKEAQQRLALARKEVLPLRREISQTMRKMYEIEAYFVQHSEAL
jgi:hypothetical protein